MFSPSRYDSLHVESSDGLVLVKMNAKRLDESNAEVVGEQLFRLVDELGPSTLQLDLGGVEYLSSGGLGKIVGLHNRVRSGGRHLSLTNVREPVYEVFLVTHLHKLLDVRPKAAS